MALSATWTSRPAANCAAEPFATGAPSQVGPAKIFTVAAPGAVPVTSGVLSLARSRRAPCAGAAARRP